MDNIDKLHYLRASLKGNALLVIDNLDFRGDNYNIAWELLCQRFYNKRLLINNHVQAIFSVESFHKESSASLRYIIDVTNKNLRALATLGSQSVDHWLVDTLIINIMTSKLDNVTKRQWEENRNTLTDSPSLSHFIKFLSNRADLLETLEEGQVPKNKLDSQKPKSFVIATGKSVKAISCPLCKQSHFLFACPDFRKLTVDERVNKVNAFNVCINCLRPGHKSFSCRLSNCKYCKLKHNTLLHVHNDVPQLQESNVALSANHSNNSNIVLLSTALVNVLDANGEPHNARILLDNGSTANFIAKDLLRKLNLPSHATGSRVIGINSQVSNSSQSCSITLKSSISDYKIGIDCFILPEITSSLPSTFININNLSLPSGIRLADPTFNIPSSVDILVGAEIFWDIVGANQIHLGKNKPTLVESKLGWLLSGVVQNNKNKSPVPVCMFTQNDRSDLDLSRFWELDTIPIKHELTSEACIRACENSFIDSTVRNNNGQFVVTIPLKETPDSLGSSFEMAKRRFLHTSHTQLKPFVRHRACEVREDFSNNTWRYVPSHDNPADLASRGLSADRIGDSSLWWSLYGFNTFSSSYNKTFRFL
ncbi:uncharacterized protein [Epargyreus clarus]|uniref:uncharacterized protein n=1 Tax=Epargyreus clarus TaxID=520877 RepID=UPI003C307358